MRVSGEGERLRPEPRLKRSPVMGGVGRPNTSVRVGEEADAGSEEARPESGGDMTGLGARCWVGMLSGCRPGEGAGWLVPGRTAKETMVFRCVPEAGAALSVPLKERQGKQAVNYTGYQGGQPPQFTLPRPHTEI